MSGDQNGHDAGAPDDSGALELPDNAQCSNCHYSQLLPVMDPATRAPVLNQKQRICRRFPPSPVLFQQPGKPPAQVGIFPNVAEDAWCYEYDERTEPEVIPTGLSLGAD